MDKQQFYELRQSVFSFLELHALHAARFLRFLLGKEQTQPLAENWWAEREYIVLVNCQTIGTAGPASLGGRPLMFDRWQSEFDRFVEQQSGFSSIHHDSSLPVISDWIWCARFLENFEGAREVAERIYECVNESGDANALQVRIVISHSEYAAQSVLGRMRESGVALDESCWNDHGERCPLYFSRPDDEAFRSEQKAACLDAAKKSWIHKLASWGTAHPVT